ncbi:hypothetical protein WS70_23285 [Burkholderia mayonis]|uniref:Uncharacterized protein n=2 Tax=Burkholderiaceae TaxID=119060 RepID=A0A1B4FLZ7_9BURK|nr:hypothetical protein WS70_23285 [Burkholderia mayonis]KVE36877.1 hypothetical protein WS69_11960 [Burkholderia sp. BDU5]KVE41235.1 hypothetical protein WS70_14510 [Burkholderia mayonis]
MCAFQLAQQRFDPIPSRKAGAIGVAFTANRRAGEAFPAIRGAPTPRMCHSVVLEKIDFAQRIPGPLPQNK